MWGPAGCCAVAWVFSIGLGDKDREQLVMHQSLAGGTAAGAGAALIRYLASNCHALLCPAIIALPGPLPPPPPPRLCRLNSTSWA